MSGAAELCHCGSGQSFAQCCNKFLLGEASAQTAEQLMRSRYCAYVVLDTNYLNSTWHPSTRPASLHLDPNVRWIGLQIKKSQAGTNTDQNGSVEFVARYKIDGRAYRLHEISQFVRQGMQWLYVDGIHP